MKAFSFLVTCLLMMSFFSSHSQAPSIIPLPGGVTWCPGELVQYEVTTGGASQAGCRYKWTISNGTIHLGQDNQRTVTVRWNDFAGNGSLTITLTNCTETTNTTASRTYAIRSLAGRVPINARANPASLAFCSTCSMFLAVDVMFLNNTGGTTGIPQLRADGYEWELPDGWSASGAFNLSA